MILTLNRELSRILLINGMVGGNAKNSMVDDITDSFDEAYANVITRFRGLINSSASIKATINGQPRNILTRRDKGVIKVQAEIGNLFTGDIIEFVDSTGTQITYLVYAIPIEYYDYVEAPVFECNQTYSLHGVNGKIPCVVTAQPVKFFPLEYKNDFIPDNALLTAMVIRDDNNGKMIKPKTRFIFNHSKTEIYEVLEINDLLYPGLRSLTLVKSRYMQEDNLETNVAYMPIKDEVKSISTGNFVILGDNKIQRGTTKTYTMETFGNTVSFAINGSGATLIDNGDGSMELSANQSIKTSQNISIRAVVNGEVVAIKKVTIY